MMEVDAQLLALFNWVSTSHSAVEGNLTVVEFHHVFNRILNAAARYESIIKIS